MGTFVFDNFQIDERASIYLDKKQTCSKKLSSGKCFKYLAFTADERIRVDFGYCEWENKERDIRIFDAEGPPRIKKLLGRLRLCIYIMGDEYAYCAITQAKEKEETTHHSNLVKAEEDLLSSLLNRDLRTFLYELGAVKIGSRGSLLGSTDRRKNELCVVFRKNNRKLPIILFILTRMLGMTPVFRTT